MARRVAVTGIGCICALGHDAASVWREAAAGRSGIAEITLVDPALLYAKNAGQVRDFDPGPRFDSKHLAVLEHFAGFAPLLASPRFMGRLSPAQQKTFLQCAKEAGQHQIAVVESEAEDIRKFLGENGMRVTRPNQKSFINAVLPLQDKFVAERGADFKTMLSKIRAAAA